MVFVEDGETNQRTPLLSRDERHNSKTNCAYGYRFRYIMGLVMIAGMTMHVYGNNTLYIASIRMVSSDVISSGLVQLGAKHQINSENVAPSGTCPLIGPGLKSPTENYELSQNASNFVHVKAKLELVQETGQLYVQVATKVIKGQLVDWSSQQRGLVFAAQKLGAVLGDIPLSRLSLIYGPKNIVLIGIGSSALRALLLPFVAGNSPVWFVIGFELIMGFLGEAIAINLNPVAATWFLPEETSAFISCFSLSYLIGSTLTNLISTQMLVNGAEWWWCFYLAGILLVVATVLWWVVGADRPQDSKFISRYELRILREQSMANCSVARQLDLAALGNSSCICSDDPLDQCPAKTIVRTPQWGAIIKCPTIWALIAANFAYYWNINISTLWPTFYSNIQHWNAATIGLITSLKGTVGLVYGLSFAYATRKLAIRRPFDMSLTAYRRLCLLLATLTLAVSVALMTAADCSMLSQAVAVALTSVVSGFNILSFVQIPLDVSPEDSGLTSAIVRTAAFGDVIATPISTYILSFASTNLEDPKSQVTGDRHTWRLVWILGLLLKLVSCVCFCLFGSSTPRSYSRVKPAGVCKSRKELDACC